tara:strand:- start:495 stop:722 length:228 start_codon:yes stop_codon:yes gene_type:complete
MATSRPRQQEAKAHLVSTGISYSFFSNKLHLILYHLETLHLQAQTSPPSSIPPPITSHENEAEVEDLEDHRLHAP